MTYFNTQYTRFTSLVIILFCFIPMACTKVVDVDVPNGGERLIIEASINWEKGTSGQNQTILLSLSTPFFEKNKFTPANNAQVTVTNVLTQDVFTFTEQEPGVYTTSSFIPVLDATYNLEVIYEEETYTASETLKPVSEITHVIQGVESIFGEESIQISAFIPDPVNQKNFYYTEFWDTQEGRSLIGREVESDELSDGNDINFEYDDENFKSGRALEINVYGISEGYFNFISLLLEQTGGEGGGPFSTIPAKLIGNCINKTNPAKETLGYFRLSEKSKYVYTIE
mgnify:CR=1 FL=1